MSLLKKMPSMLKDGDHIGINPKSDVSKTNVYFQANRQNNYNGVTKLLKAVMYT
jgi:hypothetical protein